LESSITLHGANPILGGKQPTYSNPNFERMTELIWDGKYKDGTYQVVVKVIDLLENDTTKRLTVEI